MADPEGVQGASEQIISFLKDIQEKWEIICKSTPSLIYLNPLSWSRGSAFEQKGLCFTGKPVKGEGFNVPGKGLADVSVSENHVWSLLSHKVILSLENFGKTLRNAHFCIHEGFVGFKKACSRAKPYVILTPLNYVHFYTRYSVDDVNFCDGLECIYVKYKSRASTARKLPDKYMGFCRLKHGC